MTFMVVKITTIKMMVVKNDHDDDYDDDDEEELPGQQKRRWQTLQAQERKNLFLHLVFMSIYYFKIIDNFNNVINLVIMLSSHNVIKSFIFTFWDAHLQPAPPPP